MKIQTVYEINKKKVIINLKLTMQLINLMTVITEAVQCIKAG